MKYKIEIFTPGLEGKEEMEKTNSPWDDVPMEIIKITKMKKNKIKEKPHD